MLLTLSISIYTGHVQNAVANEADWMPDANLRTAVRTALGLGDADTLTQEAMTNLTELRAGNASIADITGLEHATNLTQLDLRNNSISSITTLSGLTNLTNLWLAFNSITDISPIGSLTTLTTLTLRDNHIGNIADLGSLTNLETLWLKNCGITDVTPLQNLTNLTTLRISGNDLTNAHLLSTLANLSDIDITIPDPPPPADTVPPGVSITVPSDVQNAAFEVTITFTEAVSGFTQSGLSVGGTASVSITAWSTTDNTTFTAEVTPTGSGQVTLSIAADVATDAANNPNTAATSQTVTVNIDNQSPSVSLSVPSGIQNGAFDATITFTEAVSDFVQGDVFLTGSRSSITAWSANRDSSVYTATITPTASGTVTVAVAAGVATDAANNPNTAATSQTVTIDVDAPAVTISLPSDVQNAAFDAMLTFSEAVSDFEQSDVSLTGTATASITAWNTADNTTYTAEITPTADGTVTLSVAINVATDAAGNSNTAAIPQTVAIDLAEPIPDPATWMPDANLRAAVRSALGITSDRNFSKDDLGTLTSLRVVQSQVTDITGLEYATRLTTLIAWGNQISSVTPLENLTRLTDLRLGASQISDVTPLEGLISLTHLALQRNNISNVTPLSQLVNLTWLRLAGNPVTDFSPLSGLTSITDTDVEIPESDTEPPSVSITVPSDVQSGEFSVTINFTEDISRLSRSVSVLEFVPVLEFVTNTAGATIHSGYTLGNDYMIKKIVPTQSGVVSLRVPAGVAKDANENLNTASEIVSVSVNIDTIAEDPPESPEDRVSPSVNLTVPSDVQTGAFDVTITFTEAVSGFEQSDVSLSGTATASITAWNTTDNITYTATITPTASGTVTLSVPAGVATDVASNPNAASATQTVTVLLPSEPPIVGLGVGISVPSGPQNKAFVVTIRFTEAVSGFEQSDVSLSGTATASITAWHTTDNITYTATITPTTSGTVALSVVANVVTADANSTDISVTSQTVTIDVDPPTVALSMQDIQPDALAMASRYENTPNIKAMKQIVAMDGDFPDFDLNIPDLVTQAVEITITFSEPVFGFEQADINLEGGDSSTAAYSITAWSKTDDTTYTFTLTPTTSGQMYFTIPHGVATDAANNPNIGISLIVNISLDPPTVEFVLPSGVPTGAFSVVIMFSDSVRGFEQSDVSLSGTATASITAWRRHRGIFYAIVTPTTNGQVTLSVPAGVANSIQNDKPNTASASQTVTVNLLPPNVEITVPSDKQNGVFDATITFTEVVSGFEQSDVSISGTATASITAWHTTDNITYTATVTPTTSGTVTLSVPANVATDTASNPNAVSTAKTVTVDVDAPTVTLSVLSDTQTVAFNATITFTEAVSGFEQSDVSLSGTATASITVWHTTDNITYTATVTPTTSGTVTLSVPANVATDAVGNPNAASEPLTVIVYPAWDVNEDGSVDATDSALVTAALGQTGANIVNPRTDVNGDGTVDNADLILVTDNLDTNGGAPSNNGLFTLLDRAALEKLDPATLRAQLEILRAKSDGSLKYLRAIALLESVLNEMRPDETLLLANYPNPFNPETWIPYHLANAGDVQITIYDMQGNIIRQLDLGHQREGYYTSRSRAAYWDGRNAVGERVASGIYFYQLEADNMSLLRKMLILK